MNQPITAKGRLVDWYQPNQPAEAQIQAWLMQQNGLDADFLNPKLSQLPPPQGLPHLEESLELFVRHWKAKSKVLILGDYDVDGVTSTALLVRFFRYLGMEPLTFLPNRFRHGYGLTQASADEALALGPQLILTVDNGSTAAEQVAWLIGQGVEVIVLDHHQPSGEHFPCPLVNPRLPSCTYPDLELSGVGVVYLWLAALRAKMRDLGAFGDKVPNLLEHLDLVALGTIADQVPLQKVNRLLTRFGLLEMTKRIHQPNQDSYYLAAFDQLHPIRTMEAETIGFHLAPLLNAAGRMSDAQLALDFLLSPSLVEAKKRLGVLVELNQTRKSTQQKALKACKEPAAQQAAQYGGIAIFDPSLHEGLIGILANRLLEEFGVPVVVMTQSQEGQVKGSGRSRGINLHQALEALSHYFVQWGGHAQAAGFTLERQDLEEFQASFWEICGGVGQSKPPLVADLEVLPQMLSFDLMERLKVLEPFGQQNRKPLFMLSEMQLPAPQILAGKHLKWELDRDLEILFWDGLAKRPPSQGQFHLAGYFSVNEFRGVFKRQFTLEAWTGA